MSEDMRSRYGRYNDPPETPRDEMWDVIVARIRDEGAPQGGDAIDLDAARRSRRARMGVRTWATAAAVLVIGVALGRLTAPPGGGGTTPVEGPATPPASTTALEWAALDHLERSEALLTMVRADAREGRLDPEVAPWARTLLVETRLLLDARRGGGAPVVRDAQRDRDMDELLAELELVLMQIVGVADAGSDDDRMRTELDLAVGGMDDSEVLARIRAVVPAGMARS